MSKKSPVEIADFVSRKRAIGFIVGTIVFLGVQFIARPVFRPHPGSQLVQWAWPLNAGLLMACLWTGGGLALGRRVRSLMNDEISRDNYRKATTVGYWVASLAGLAIFGIAGRVEFTSREAVYIIVTCSLCAAMFVFSILELRAHAAK